MLMTRKQAAQYLLLKESTLKQWEFTRKYGLKFVKIGSLTRYTKEHLDEFIESRTESGSISEMAA